MIKRYKRFIADIELDSGEKATVHCPHPGSMKGCAIPGAQGWLSRNDNPKRKLKYTWELISEMNLKELTLYTKYYIRFLSTGCNIYEKLLFLCVLIIT